MAFRPRHVCRSTYYPIIRIKGDFRCLASGHGMIIITGNLTISGSKGWSGVLLVGDDITSER